MFVHNKTRWWVGAHYAEFVTWSPANEKITQIYNTINASASRMSLSKIEKKLLVTPALDNMICDIYIQEFPATIL